MWQKMLIIQINFHKAPIPHIILSIMSVFNIALSYNET